MDVNGLPMWLIASAQAFGVRPGGKASHVHALQWNDQRGEKLSELGRNEEGIISAEFDRDKVREDRASMGFFRDRRPELYKRLCEP